MASQDSQLDLKKRARRRLVGASALALLAAIVLPSVMDKEPRPVGQSLTIRMAGQEAAGGGGNEQAVRSSPLSGVVPTESITQSDSASQSPLVPSGGAGVPSQPPVAPPLPAKSQILAPTHSSSVSVPQKPKENPLPVKGAEKGVTTSGHKAEAASAPQEGHSGGHYVVQLGSFSDDANVNKLRQKIKAAGYNSSIEVLKTPDGTKTRVRAGPFVDAVAAYEARERLKNIGLQGMVAEK